MKKHFQDLTPLERGVMRLLLAGVQPALRVLRRQLDVSHVRSRESTGTGFVTTFAVPEECERVRSNRNRIDLGGVVAEIEGLEFGAGFALFIKNGGLECLEGYSFEEPWPSEIAHFRLSYCDGDPRNLDTLGHGMERGPDRE